MISRTVTVASTVLAIALLGAPAAMANPTGAAATGASSGAASCSGTLGVTASPTAVTVAGTVRCASDTSLTLRTSADAGQLAIQTSSQVHATANQDTAIHATIPIPGCTNAAAVLVDTRTGTTVTATAS
jgi:hypothetical protein